MKHVLKHYNGLFLSDNEGDFLLLTRNVGEALPFDTYWEAQEIIDQMKTISFEICKLIDINDLW